MTSQSPYRLGMLRNATWLLAGLALLLMAACKTTASVETEPPSAMCVAFKPIYWSKDDTVDTQKQAVAHNAAWKALCGK